MRALQTRASRSTGLLRAGLVALLFVACGLDLVRLARVYPPLVDLEIPLRAAERWLAGGSPYLASSFSEPAGYGLPFLYAPPTLPVLRRPVAAAARGRRAPVAGGVSSRRRPWGTRRLGIPWVAVPLAHGLAARSPRHCWGATSRSSCSRRWSPSSGTARRARGIRGSGMCAPRRIPVRTGTLAAFIPAMKISIPHAWVGVAGRRPTTAIVGALAAGGSRPRHAPAGRAVGMAGVAPAAGPGAGPDVGERRISAPARSAGGGERGDLARGRSRLRRGSRAAQGNVGRPARRSSAPRPCTCSACCSSSPRSWSCGGRSASPSPRSSRSGVSWAPRRPGCCGSGQLVAAASLALGDRWPGLIDRTGRDAESAPAPA